MKKAYPAGSTKKTPDCLMGHAVISGNLAKGFVVLKDAAQHLRPFFSGDAVLRLMLSWMLLYFYEGGILPSNCSSARSL
jgi:hypothetical protein